MASKLRTRSTGIVHQSCSRNLGRHTDPIINAVRDCRSGGKRKSEESPEKASKRSRTIQSHSEGIRQSFGGPSSSDADIFVTAYTDFSDNTETFFTAEDAGTSKPTSARTSTKAEEKKSRKRKTEETEGLSKRNRMTPSPSEDPSHQATKTSNSSSHESTCSTDSRDDFEARYKEEELLGEGGFGSVFAGYCKDDNLPVAIKHIHQFLSTTVCLNGESTILPLEVALLMKLQPAEGETSAVVSLHDWYELGNELIIILERPVPCMDLHNYIKSRESPLQEDEVKIIARQLVDGLHEVHSRGVFHRDIKLENILIETGSDVPRARLIDFGCGTFLSEERYTTKRGTFVYRCPEWFKLGWYTAEGTNVWQLGVVLFEMLHNGRLPFYNAFEISNERPKISASISNDCQDFLLSCLDKSLEDRPTLETLKYHPWLM
ncbi:serine/threonine-protein kinase pim-2-like [Sebastes umbrosus]|uniref:serine/threonine-protein kinase pim-2-like n=1 Tax=Sebastes umbrosus TaxID=72105 RepID=UPI00189E9E78|nr:serine/threonine-protein kinase pim-2-like [Sebastes umbrosus]